MIKVSAVIPTFNRAHLVGRAVRSTLLQTLEDIEVIVVDDCSTDSTPQLLKQISEKEPKVRHIRLNKNGGVASAVNGGIAAARGKYVVLLADDDIAMPDCFERLSSHLTSHPETGFIYPFCAVQRGERFFLQTHRISQVSYEHALSGPCPVTPCWMLPKAVLDDIGGYDETLRVGEDADLFRRLVHGGWKVDYVETVEAVQMDAGVRLSRDSEMYVRVCKRELERFAADFERFPRARSRMLASLGMHCARSRDRRRAVASFLESVRAFPFNPLVWAQLLAILGGSNSYACFECIYRGVRFALTPNRIKGELLGKIIRRIEECSRSWD